MNNGDGDGGGDGSTSATVVVVNSAGSVEFTLSSELVSEESELANGVTIWGSNVSAVGISVIFLTEKNSWFNVRIRWISADRMVLVSDVSLSIDCNKSLIFCSMPSHFQRKLCESLNIKKIKE